MVKLRRIRGLGIRYYILSCVVGVASAFYIFKPTIDVLEQRRLEKEQQESALAIEKVSEIKRAEQ